MGEDESICIHNHQKSLIILYFLPHGAFFFFTNLCCITQNMMQSDEYFKNGFTPPQKNNVIFTHICS